MVAWLCQENGTEDKKVVLLDTSSCSVSENLKGKSFSQTPPKMDAPKQGHTP